MGEKAEAEIETPGMTEAKGAAASTTANPGEINAPECYFATHKEKNTGGNGSRITVIDSSNTSNGEIRGDIMHAQRAKMGIKIDRDSEVTQWEY